MSGVLGSSATYFAVRGVNGLIALAAIAVLTRLMSPKEYGEYALGMATMMVLATVLFQWLNVSLARFHAAHAPKDDGLMTVVQGLFLRVAGVSLVGAAAWTVAEPLAFISLAAVVTIMLGAIALGLHDLHLQLANSRGQPLRYGLITSSRAIFALVLATSLVLAGAGATGALAAFGIACVTAVVLFGARWSRQDSPDGSTLRRQLIVFGLPVAVASMSTMVLAVTDRFLIGLWHGSAAVAGYAAAFDLTQQTVGVALNVFFISAYPRVVAAWEAGGDTAARTAIVPLGQALLLAAPLAVGFFAGLAPEIAALMFGADIRADAALVIPWIALAVAIGCIKSYLLDIAFHLSKSVPVLLRITTAMAALNVMLNVLLIPSLGFLGAALAILVALAGGAALSWWFGRNTCLYRRLGLEMVKGAAAAAVMVTTIRFGFSSVLSAGEVDALPALLRLTAGVATFSALAWLLDLAQLRTHLMRRRRPILRPTR